MDTDGNMAKLMIFQFENDPTAWCVKSAHEKLLFRL